ncbi:MAG TPA: S-adenosylmethionine:tRNA ribosyltransferase-isomerase, partial [bacterium]|nr:S-adenosylmethionine:tRNA ribosyltransferase-isomerase [bacterium]
SGGRLGILLLAELAPDRARVLIRGRVHPGLVLPLDEASRLEILQRLEAGAWEVRFHGRSAAETLARHGEVPLPPYIRRPARASDRADYQTVYARREGAVAAPTAGLHFTDGLLKELEDRGVGRAFLTLHTGWGTFQPLRSETVEAHRMDPEYFELPAETAAAVNKARQEKRPVTAVGTTVVRTLEGRGGEGRLEAAAGWVNAFIYPGYRFRIVDAMVTNFHLPRTTTLLLTAAFAGPDRLLAAYRFALERGFRFGSYGDAMLIT